LPFSKTKEKSKPRPAFLVKKAAQASSILDVILYHVDQNWQLLLPRMKGEEYAIFFSCFPSKHLVWHELRAIQIYTDH
jgi:hypothetical protein